MIEFITNIFNIKFDNIKLSFTEIELDNFLFNKYIR